MNGGQEEKGTEWNESKSSGKPGPCRACALDYWTGLGGTGEKGRKGGDSTLRDAKRAMEGITTGDVVCPLPDGLRGAVDWICICMDDTTPDPCEWTSGRRADERGRMGVGRVQQTGGHIWLLSKPGLSLASK